MFKKNSIHSFNKHKNKLVSIVVTTKNEEDVIGRLIKSIYKQNYSNFEIILVDNNSIDKTLEIAQKFKIRTYNFGPERSFQRNFGAQKSKGKFLLFLDADMEVSKDVVRQCVKESDKDPNLAGIVIPEKSKAYNFWERIKAYERSFYNEEGDEITDAARFFRKEVFEKTGGYDETITGPEDWDLSETIKKSDYKIGRVTSQIYHHERISSPLILLRKKFYYALSLHRYLKKQKIGIIGPKTIYFLRPIFYKKWRKLALNPLLSLGLIFILSLELAAGVMGYILGRIRYK